ncbi:hypothetical protein L1889_05500 [Paenalcaligenes niemegkensis]|uniref:type IV pilus assembly protein FimV n=1 Tax=Paenalcaligenes niemegkensis TaxID=2895469 RepID=UPI001EE938C1|nr:FimV/HubP family polar landmark protein [Paenalcaligenes niemegkensis]MCQ9616224.1 hypothetical protein [Paenalcaligenes niemegkensis]
MRQRRLFLLTFKYSIAATLAALSCASAYAVEVGHARVLSAADQPLRIGVQLRDIGDDPSTLSVSLPALADWQAHGLTPPLALASMTVQIDAQASRLLILAEQPSQLKVVDVLVDVSSPQGVQRHQVSVLNASVIAATQLPGQSDQAEYQDAQATSSPTVVRTADSGSEASIAPETVIVQAGDSLSRIAQRHRSSEFSSYQYMAAMHAANPQAFGHGNINLIQAGTHLTQPGLEQIQRFSDQEARQLFVQHAQWFERYKSQLAAGKTPLLAAQDATQGSAEVASESLPETVAQGDRLELSATDAMAARADKAVATSEELSLTGQKVSQLEENLSNLNQALRGQGEAAKEALLDGVRELGVDFDIPPASDSASAASSDASPSLNGPNAVAQPSEPVPNTKAGKTLSWIQEHMLVVMSSLLLILVLITVWILRRANTTRSDIDSPAPVSADMVREKLEKISLDLDVPPSDEPPKSH